MRARVVAFILLVLLLTVASISAQGDIAEVPREATVIFENIEGRVPVPDNMNPYISGQYLDWACGRRPRKRSSISTTRRAS